MPTIFGQTYIIHLTHRHHVHLVFALKYIALFKFIYSSHHRIHVNGRRKVQRSHFSIYYKPIWMFASFLVIKMSHILTWFSIHNRVTSLDDISGISSFICIFLATDVHFNDCDCVQFAIQYYEMRINLLKILIYLYIFQILEAKQILSLHEKPIYSKTAYL